MSWIPTKFFYLLSWMHMMVINCPKYDNMTHCVSFIKDLPVYINDYHRFEQDKADYLSKK